MNPNDSIYMYKNISPWMYPWMKGCIHGEKGINPWCVCDDERMDESK